MADADLRRNQDKETLLEVCEKYPHSIVVRHKVALGYLSTSMRLEL